MLLKKRGLMKLYIILIFIYLFGIECYANTMKDIENLNSQVVEIKNNINDIKDDIQEIEIVVEEIKEERSKYREVDANISFYTNLPSENGGYSVTSLGNPHIPGITIAAPKDIPFGTKIDCGIYGLRSVDDRGGAIKWNGNIIKLDIFIARNKGETDQQYKNRVNSMGRLYTKVKIFNDIS